MREYVVVTGASSGLGKALAVIFANRGYSVLAVGRNEIELERLKKLASSGEIIKSVTDLRHVNAVDKIVNQIDSRKIKYLIHCAGTMEPYKPLIKVTETEFDDNFTINVKAPILLTQKLVPYFVDNGRILFIGSDYVGTTKVRPNLTGAYGISKSGLRSAIEYFRLEITNPAVGHLIPGTMDTPMLSSFLSALRKQAGSPLNVNPAKVNDVATFVADVLENSSRADFTKLDWDFRNPQHHQVLEQYHNHTNSLLKSRL